jgi:hypothetical protein
MKALQLLLALLPVSNVLAELILDSSFRPPSIERKRPVGRIIPRRRTRDNLRE